MKIQKSQNASSASFFKHASKPSGNFTLGKLDWCLETLAWEVEDAFLRKHRAREGHVVLDSLFGHRIAGFLPQEKCHG